MPATAAKDNETLDHLLSVGALNGWPDRPVMLKRIVRVRATNVALRLRGGNRFRTRTRGTNLPPLEEFAPAVERNQL